MFSGLYWNQSVHLSVYLSVCPCVCLCTKYLFLSNSWRGIKSNLVTALVLDKFLAVSVALSLFKPLLRNPDLAPLNKKPLEKLWQKEKMLLTNVFYSYETVFSILVIFI